MLQGVYTALVTPFREGAVDRSVFADLCRRQLAAGVAGLVPCGTTGETPTLTQDEWSDLVRIAVEVAAGTVPVIAGCGTNNTASTCATLRAAKALGADAGLVVFPYYNKPNPSGLLAHVQAACDQDLPLVLYHVPGRTGQRLDAELLERLCRVPGVIGLKEATGDVTLGQELCNRLSDTQVALLSGDDFTYAAAVAMGFHGVISVLSNPAPALSVAWYQAANEGNIQSLRQLRQRLLPVVEGLFAGPNPVPCKALMAGMGLVENEVRLPLAPTPIPEANAWAGLR